MVEKRTGRISNIEFGRGGIDDLKIGFFITLIGEGWYKTDELSTWDYNCLSQIKKKDYSKKEIEKAYIAIIKRISDLIHQGGVYTFEELKGLSIQASFEDTDLINWEIDLTQSRKSDKTALEKFEDRQLNAPENKKEKTTPDQEDKKDFQERTMVELLLEVRHETEKAYLVWDEEKEEWLPKSQIKSIERNNQDDDDLYDIVIPEWLAKAKGLL